MCAREARRSVRSVEAKSFDPWRQTSKQTNKQTNKQTSKQTSKEANRQADNVSRHTNKQNVFRNPDRMPMAAAPMAVPNLIAGDLDLRGGVHPPRTDGPQPPTIFSIRIDTAWESKPHNKCAPSIDPANAMAAALES